MKYNIKKYEKRRFHKDPDVDKKIKALFLWFDYEVETRDLTYTQQLTLIDNWITSFLFSELYEVVPMFKLRRGAIVKLIAHRRRAKKSGDIRLASYLRLYRMKLKRWVKSLFADKTNKNIN